jgi:Rrf2 family protein
MNSRFTVAVHVLTFLALSGDGPTPSEYIAESASTHPVVVRRILSSLRRAGLVTAQPGMGGGSSLARPPADITLLDVYRATADRDLFALHFRSPNPNCACGSNIQPVLLGVFGAAESALEGVLSGITVADVAGEIEARTHSRSNAASRDGNAWPQGSLPEAFDSFGTEDYSD